MLHEGDFNFLHPIIWHELAMTSLVRQPNAVALGRWKALEDDMREVCSALRIYRTGQCSSARPT